MKKEKWQKKKLAKEKKEKNGTEHLPHQMFARQGVTSPMPAICNRITTSDIDTPQLLFECEFPIQTAFGTIVDFRHLFYYRCLAGIGLASALQAHHLRDQIQRRFSEYHPRVFGTLSLAWRFQYNSLRFSASTGFC